MHKCSCVCNATCMQVTCTVVTVQAICEGLHSFIINYFPLCLLFHFIEGASAPSAALLLPLNFSKIWTLYRAFLLTPLWKAKTVSDGNHFFSVFESRLILIKSVIYLLTCLSNMLKGTLAGD